MCLRLLTCGPRGGRAAGFLNTLATTPQPSITLTTFVLTYTAEVMLSPASGTGLMPLWRVCVHRFGGRNLC